METLQGVHFVRLECLGRRGAYVAADEDRTGVSLRSGHREASKILWRVEADAGVDREAGFLLHGAYGHYLVASDIPAATGPPGAVIAQQRAIARNSAPPLSFFWKIVLKEDGIFIQNLKGSFLRANGKYLRWRRAITVALDKGSSMLRWSVEVPVRPELFVNLGSPRIQQYSNKTLRKEAKKELRSILVKIEEEQSKKNDLELKKKEVQAKMQRLKSQQQRVVEERRRNPTLNLH